MLLFLYSWMFSKQIYFESRVDIIANYVRLNIDPGKGIYEYEVRFEPLIDSKDIRFKLLNKHREFLGSAKTFDGVTLYLPHQLENNVSHLQVKLLGKIDCFNAKTFFRLPISKVNTLQRMKL